MEETLGIQAEGTEHAENVGRRDQQTVPLMVRYIGAIRGTSSTTSSKNLLVHPYSESG